MCFINEGKLSEFIDFNLSVRSFWKREKWSARPCTEVVRGYRNVPRATAPLLVLTTNT